MGLKEKLAEFDAQKKEKMATINKINYAGIPLTIIGVVFIFLVIAVDNIPDFLAIVAFGFILIGALLMALAYKKKADLMKEFKKMFIPELLTDLYPDAKYFDGKGIEIRTILYPGFFKSPDRSSTKDYFTASYKGVPFEMSDYDLQEEHRSTDSQGHTTVTYQTYAKGRMIVIDFKREFDGIVKVMETKWLGASTHGLKKVETESLEFNKKFSTYSTDALKTFYILTPQVQLKLLEMEKKFKGSIFFSFDHGKFYVAINDSRGTMDFSLKKELSQEMIDNLSNQLMVPAAVINELKFDSDKYTRSDAI